MKVLLRLDCSSRLEGSHSRELADYFEENWLANNSNGEVIKRDLVKTTIPHIQNRTIEGFYTPADSMGTALKEATALSNQLIEELELADEILIASPLYNLNIPSNLKAYLDHVVRIGYTFKVDGEDYHGLLKNKTAHLITVKGGFFKDGPLEAMDFQDAYLPAILGFIGITRQNLFFLEGTTDTGTLGDRKKTLQDRIAEMISNSSI